MSGEKRTAIIGAYLIPGKDLPDLPHLDEAMRRFPDCTPIVLGDLNANLSKANSRANQINAALAPYGLTDLLLHYKQRTLGRDLFTYCFTPDDPTQRLRRSRCDYILSPDRRQFKTVQIRKPQYYVSDHRMVVAKYLLEPAKCHYRYLKGRKALPFAMPSGPMPKMDFLFQQVVDQTPDPPRRNDPARKPWISEETLKIWDERCALHRTQRHCQAESRRLTRKYKAGLKADRKRRTEKVAENIMAYLDWRRTGPSRCLPRGCQVVSFLWWSTPQTFPRRFAQSSRDISGDLLRLPSHEETPSLPLRNQPQSTTASPVSLKLVMQFAA